MTALDSHLGAALATAVFEPSFPGFDAMVDTGPIPIVSPTAPACVPRDAECEPAAMGSAGA